MLIRKEILSSGVPVDRESSQTAFTLIELLLVIAITTILLGLTMAAVMKARDSVARLQCSDRLRQIGFALHQYHGSHGHLPPGVSYKQGKDRHPWMSWLTRILPNVEQEAVWRQAEAAYDQDKWFEDVPPHVGLATVIPLYGCPSDTRTSHVGNITDGGLRVAFTSYLGVEGRDQYRTGGVLFLDSAVRFADITDGTSNTLMVGERPPSADNKLGWWYAGWGQGQDGSAEMVLGAREINIFYPDCGAGASAFGQGKITDNCSALHFWSLHGGGGANFAFADGSVHFLSYSAAPIMPALASRAGGETVDLDQ